MNLHKLHGIRSSKKRISTLGPFTLAALSALCLAVSSYGEDAKPSEPAPKKTKSGVQQIVFEEQKIEGKIRRPQMVLIKADQRPGFTPMVLQSFGKSENIAEFVDQWAIETMPNQNAFQFNGTKVGNVVP